MNNLELFIDDIPVIQFNIITDNTEQEPIYNKHMCKILADAKNKIDDNKDWDKGKKLINDYELIHQPIRKKKNDSIALYNPLSRSYFKMWELLHDFNLLNDNITKKIACIAEGPGGFIEAINNYRKNMNLVDDIYGITLRSIKNEIPGWRKSREFLKNNKNICIHYGQDNTGDIYKVKNIKSFREKVGNNSCELVTADGGFDFSIDFNKQEQLSYRIIFCEIVTALSVQKIHGSFICKIFDMYTYLTVKLIYILNIFYSKVTITKPNTSRPANSEKYIVAENFKGISEDTLNNLFMIVDRWHNIEEEGKYVKDICINEIPKKYIEKIINYNKANSYKQFDNIIKTLTIIRNNFKKNKKTIDEIVEKQIILAIDWCKKYNVNINNESKYLIK